jgi:hypothetical protein
MCLRFVFLLITRLTGWLRLSRREETWKTAEILILPHQLAVLQRRQPRLWVPETVSPHATWAYSWRRPPSLSGRMTLTSASTGSGSTRSGLAWFSARCGRCPL